ncbi:conserved Plasmodium protein, unknown function [Plasmodium knowlesi strain H]|uniref:CS domain-containing protein n=3 Tax=Plasmodium knowlesi TaxID=5850 RepID=A0A5K1UMP6_PLAKH|nr:HSP20-like chaperone, putative [Plasmodium knowlesi strain H]OTN65411.1 Uncharacterized protein PKNOH_S110104300 [Plasmodium knowlesi]CAA9989662.1 HSP20-like chaperone, putative [Plasmodium knowlesi strain H]SBO22783.1 conserved Plasmodium protein, unknown function [Plasmodium knowlesi strain H]SBO23120.1 conserved Plasmodium protein, unknown function [Plasmodium knowlesi strain H]VVS79136.1 HSP20-like chaperone, putative [Plasmodium knowlesi strain H]|eukprot:XP_002260386.1 hypothetical protein, conserved in Plasmodium species [Plasmodium knowlesi strain H]
MSSPINYSKFDQIDVSSSDDERKSRKPQVTTLGKKDKVVLSPSGLTILKDGDGEINDTKVCKSTNQEHTVPHIESKSLVANKNGVALTDKKEDVLKNKKHLENMITNGAVVPFKYIWNQSIQEINAYIALPLYTKAKSLVVQIQEDKMVVKKVVKNGEAEHIRSAQSRNDTCNHEEVLIDKPFPYKVSEDEDTQLWEIKNIKINWQDIFHLSNKVNNQNLHFNFGENSIEKEETFLCINLKKKYDFEGFYVWWACLFKDDQPINLSSLPTRKTMNNTGSGSTSFKNIWQEAHETFKKNISKRGLPHRVDL